MNIQFYYIQETPQIDNANVNDDNARKYLPLLFLL